MCPELLTTDMSWTWVLGFISELFCGMPTERMVPIKPADLVLNAVLGVAVSDGILLLPCVSFLTCRFKTLARRLVGVPVLRLNGLD